VDHKQIGQYLPDIYASLQDMDWKDIIKHFVSLEFNSLLEYYRGEMDLSPGEKKTRAHSEHPRTRNEQFTPVEKKKKRKRFKPAGKHRKGTSQHKSGKSEHGGKSGKRRQQRRAR